AKYEAFVRSFQARHPRVLTILDARRAGYGPAMFVDATHLGGRGAIALSREVGRTLRTELAHSRPPAEPRWINLGDPEPSSMAPDDLALEDLDQSRRALALDGDGGRSIR